MYISASAICWHLDIFIEVLIYNFTWI